MNNLDITDALLDIIDYDTFVLAFDFKCRPLTCSYIFIFFR